MYGILLLLLTYICVYMHEKGWTITNDITMKNC